MRRVTDNRLEALPEEELAKLQLQSIDVRGNPMHTAAARAPPPRDTATDAH
jgi:hypothetical protein